MHTCIFLFRHETDLYLLVHHLYATLPDQVVVVAKEPSDGCINDRCIKALQKEAHFLSQSLQKLLNDHDQKQASSDFDAGAEDDLRKVGEKFKRKQQQLKQNDKAHLQLATEDLCQLKEELSSIREKTDITFASCPLKK